MSNQPTFVVKDGNGVRELRPGYRDRRGTVFVLRLRADPNDSNSIRNLRALLKLALRRYRLRCVSAVEVRE